jgi:hypothetical protein
MFGQLKAKTVPLHTAKALGGGGYEVSSYSFTTSAVDGGEWSAMFGQLSTLN